VIPTPALDRIAKLGLRYTQFHSTALCSPTRAALITGRNHHSVGFGVVSELATGFPGYDSVIEKTEGTIGEILKRNGYATSWFGKDHTTAMADDAIAYMKNLNELAPDKPFFVYYVPGGTHAPHHPTPEWIKKISDMKLFDKGWNALREAIFTNQKKLGVIPANAQLSAWPKDLPQWDTLTFEQKKLYVRQVDIYAAYLAYTDHEIGRVIQEVEDLGKLDNTLIIYISGDNGASAEGTMNGTPNEVAPLNGLDIPLNDQFLWYEAWGSDKTYPHMAVPWAWAFDTPFQWTKQMASHFGGTRQGMTIAWPKRIKDAGGIRPQFHHVIDVVPTILEAAGIPAPATIDGLKQKPIEGVSMAYSWDKASAGAKSKHTTQYFEILGNRAIYSDGWVAATTPVTFPWHMTPTVPDVIDGYKWELYDVGSDFSQAENLAPKMPDKLKQMQALFYAEAKKYQVLPLDNSTLTRIVAARPSVAAGRRVFTYAGEHGGIPNGSEPSILQRSYTITAEVTIPEGGAEGMIVTQGGRFAGYGFYLSKGELGVGRGKPVFLYNLLDLKREVWSGPELKAGRHTLLFDFKFDGGGFGKGGTGTLIVDGKEVDKKSMEHTMPITFPEDEDFEIGHDTRTGVALLEYRYDVPFRFTGKINKVTFNLGPEMMTAQEREQVQESLAQARDQR